MTDELKARLLARLDRSEDSWMERKESFDEREVRKTLVGFANSVREGEMAVLFLGARNDGRHPGLADADNCQKKVAGVARKCYPPNSYQPGVLGVHVNGSPREILAIMVTYGKRHPHFSGPAYVHRGSETLEASQEMFEELITSQHDKARRILQHKRERLRLRLRSASSFWFDVEVALDRCDAHSVTFRRAPKVTVTREGIRCAKRVLPDGCVVLGFSVGVRLVSPRVCDSEIKRAGGGWRAPARASLRSKG